MNKHTASVFFVFLMLMSTLGFSADKKNQESASTYNTEREKVVLLYKILLGVIEVKKEYEDLLFDKTGICYQMQCH